MYLNKDFVQVWSTRVHIGVTLKGKKAMDKGSRMQGRGIQSCIRVMVCQ